MSQTISSSESAPSTNKHPKGLYYLFFSEMWERFSYYGMRAILVLFMTGELLFSDRLSYLTYGTYTAFVYMTPVIGGYLADRVIGYRRAVILGAILIMIGHIMLAMQPIDTLGEYFFFYVGLAFIVAGTGFFKGNVSSMVSHLYNRNDTRRDSGFTIFYMGINLGAFISSLSVPIVAAWLGWHYGFALAAIGMFFGLMTFIRAKKYFSPKSDQIDLKDLTKKVALGLTKSQWIYISSIFSIPLFAWLLANPGNSGLILAVIGGALLLYFILVALRSNSTERNHIFAILILSFFTMFFWAFFEQAGSSINLFIDRNIDRFIFGWQIPTGSFQSLNAMFIILLAPFFAALWIALAKRKKDPSTPVKFSLGILFVGLGFISLAIGAYFASKGVMASMLWIVLAYLLHTIGELCLSPVGLSAVSKLSPPKLLGMMMGAWFLATAFAQYIAGLIALLTSPIVEGEIQRSLSTIEYADIYFDVFIKIGLTAVSVAFIVWLIAPLVNRLMRNQAPVSAIEEDNELAKR